MGEVVVQEVMGEVAVQEVMGKVAVQEVMGSGKQKAMDTGSDVSQQSHKQTIYTLLSKLIMYDWQGFSGSCQREEYLSATKFYVQNRIKRINYYTVDNHTHTSIISSTSNAFT